MSLQRSFAQQEGQERQFDLTNQLERDKMNAQLEASRYLGQAQLAAANKKDGLLGLGIAGL